VFMNWLIREKMFTYFYNKFRPVNCVHFIKLSVKILLLTQFWLLQTIRGNLDHYSITIEKFGVLQVYFSVVVRETRHHAQADITFRALIRCSLSHATRWTNTAAECVGFCWPVLAAVESHNVCCSRTWPSNQIGGGAILTSSSFFNQIPHQEKSEISVGIFSPTWR
jgi:hypothetical protein